VLAANPTFTGVVLEQMPPQYSAKRVGGRRAYDIARSGAVAELAPARVRVDGWELARLGAATRATCGSRAAAAPTSLARRDLGRLTGQRAHLTRCVARGAGAFDVRDRRLAGRAARHAAALRPAVAALPELPTQPVTDEEAGRLARASTCLPPWPGAWGALIHDGTARSLALAERRGDERWQPGW
jgi:tRNA pseudouridine55 synthase